MSFRFSVEKINFENMNVKSAKYVMFDNVQYEDILYCNSEEFSGGLLESEIYYCPIKLIDFFKTPSLHSGFESSGKITQKIVCKPNYGFRKIKALVDSSTFDSDLSGAIGKKDASTDFELQIIGLRARLIGFSRSLRNIPCIYIVRDQNGRQFTIGTLVSPAYISSFRLSPGKKYEDDSGAIVKLTTSAIIYEYQNEIPTVKDTGLGDFDLNFHSDFD